MARYMQTALSQLHSLVKSLDKKERQLFWEYVRGRKAPNNSDSNYVQLFETLLAMSSLVPERVSRLFKSKSSQSVAMAHLRKIIFEALAIENGPSFQGIAVARKAFEKGFHKYAQKILSNEIGSATDSGDLVYLFSLGEELKFLRKFYGYETHEGSLKDAYQEFSLLLRSQCLYSEMKESLVLSPKERMQVHLKLAGEIEAIWKRCKSPKVDYSILKTTQLWHRLGNQSEKLFSIQKRIIELIEEKFDDFRTEEVLDEYHFLITILTIRENYKEADRLLQKLSSIEVLSYQEKLRTRLIISDSLTLAACKGDVKFGEVAVRDFVSNFDSFSDSRKAILSHFSAMIFFYKEDWSKVLEFQNLFRKHIKGTSTQHSWVPVIIKSIAFFELGNFSECKKYLRKHSAVHCDPYPYPRYMARVLGELISSFENQFHFKRILEEANCELELLASDPGTKPFLNYFNASLWINSHRKGFRIQELVLSEQFPKLVSLKKVV